MQDEGVEQALAADLEFDLRGLLVALYPCSWGTDRDVSLNAPVQGFPGLCEVWKGWDLRRTGGIFALADLEEL